MKLVAAALAMRRNAAPTRAARLVWCLAPSMLAVACATSFAASLLEAPRTLAFMATPYAGAPTLNDLLDGEPRGC